jgi:hypothetical protein
MAADTRIDGLAKHFRQAPGYFGTSPLYQALCPVVAVDEPLLELLTRRRSGQQPSFLLFAAVHALLLAGVDHGLREYYPSLVGEAARQPDGVGPVFLDFCRTHRAALEELIATRLVQSNVVRRAIGLRFALWAVGRRWAGPVHLVEVGASAGLLMNVDRYRFDIGGRRFGPPGASVTLDARWRGAGQLPDLDDVPRIVGKTGIDLNPIDLADTKARNWLRALIWPEQRSAAALLEAAVDEALAQPVTIIAGDAVEVCPVLAGELPAGEARVVFHAATRMHVPAERRRRFDEAIDSLGAGGPLFHVWLEPSGAPHHGYPVSELAAIAMHGPGDDAATALVRVDGHLHWLAPVV